MRTFTDMDGIRVVTLKNARVQYPNLNWGKITKRFAWVSDKWGDILTVRDLNLCIRLNNEGLDIEDIEYTDVAWCEVCEKVLLPDDECYSDKGGLAYCTIHCIFDEETGLYVKSETAI